MRLITLCAAALLLAGCADSTVSRTSGVYGSSDTTSARPNTIVVTDFTVSSDLVVIDRGYTARLERKIGPYPTFERKQRTLERVNDEIIATIVATLRSAGLEAQSGSQESLSLAERAVVVSGRLVPANPSAKKNEAGIGGGHGGVSAEMSLSSSSTFGNKKLYGFVTDPADGKKSIGAKNAAAANAAITAVLGDKAAVKLSPDVEAAARALGRAAGEKIIAFARTQGWLSKPNEGEAAPEAKDNVVKLPAARPAGKPAA